MTRRQIRLLAAASAAALSGVAVLAARTARAAPNPNWPPPKGSADSVYEDPASWPSEWQNGGPNWELLGFQPPNGLNGSNLDTTLEKAEKGQPIGQSADRAWSYTIGDPRVTIAVLDSGFLWEEPDLVNKWRLNPGELPVPQGVAVCPGGTAWAGGDHDANGDGVFNVQDYTSACGHEQPTAATVVDPRVSDLNGNGLIDPEDLIAAFSDGVDDDHNGYVDDICGWDFNWNDNDPFDDVHNGGEGYSHGTGEAKDSGAEANNDIAGLGVCPRCMILPLRAGESFVAEATNFGEAVVYATDNHASLVQEALGTITNTALMQAGIDYAYAHGVAVVASAADETSYHHNYPGNWEHTLYVHAIRYDTDSWRQATTFLNYTNCTNFGGHLALSTPGTACSSEATGKSSGEAGLVYSMALQSGLTPPLDAEELFQVMVTSSDDIDVPGSDADPTKYPSKAGWDAHFGWGRNNAFNAVKMVADGRIPPEVDVTAPKWFETFTSSDARAVEIVGRIDARRAGGNVSWKVKAARGLEPDDSSFVDVAQGSGPVSGLIAKVDLAKLVPSADETVMTSNDFDDVTVTIWVQAVAHYPDARGDVPGQFRKTVFVHDDPDLFAGFPLWLGVSGESSPHLADLDGDGKDEIVVGTSDGLVHAIRASAVLGAAHGAPVLPSMELPGFPVAVGRYSRLDPQNPANHLAAPGFQAGGAMDPALVRQSITSTVAVGDLDGDGKPDVVAATYDGEIFAFDHLGQPLAGFPVELDPAHFSECFISRFPGDCRATGVKVTSDATHVDTEWRIMEHGFFASPVIADVNGDGKPDLLAAGMDGYLYAWDGHGQLEPGYPVLVADPAGDNQGTDSSGRTVTEHMRTQLMGTPAVGDVDGDGKPDVAAVSNEAYGGQSTRAYLLHGDGTYFAGWPVAVPAVTNSVLPLVGRGIAACPIMADLDGDGRDEVAMGPLDSTMRLWKPGDAQAGKPFLVTDANYGKNAAVKDYPLHSLNNPAFADLDLDGKLELVNGTLGVSSFAANAGDSGHRHDVAHQVTAWAVGKGAATGCGTEKGVACTLDAFPRRAEDFQLFTNYAAGDVSGDGKPEIVSGSGGYLVTAYDAAGAQPPGWPKWTGGWNLATPALGDLDGDGLLDVVEVTREGWLYAWHTAGAASSIQWAGFHHDAANTGNYGTPLAHYTTHVVPKPGKSGCGCGSGEASWLAFALLAAVALRRRLA